MQIVSCKSNGITRAGKLYEIVYIINSKLMTQVNQNLTHDRLSSERYLCRFRLKHDREMQDLMFGGREFQRDAPENERLLLNKSILVLVSTGYSSSWCNGTGKNESCVR